MEKQKTNLSMEIGKRVEKKRKELHLSQEQLAERVGYTSKSSISLIESGKRAMTQDKALIIAKALNVPLSYLYGEDSHVEQNNNTNSTVTNDSNNTTNNFFKQKEPKSGSTSTKAKSFFFEIIDRLREMDDKQLEKVLDFCNYLLHR